MLSDMELFHPRPAIKAQVLTNFLSEMTGEGGEQTCRNWKLYVDEFSASIGSGVRIVLESPEGDKLKYIIKLEFLALNNEADYEATLVGCRLALAARAQRVHANSKSQLVVNQAVGNTKPKTTRWLNILHACPK